MIGLSDRDFLVLLSVSAFVAVFGIVTLGLVAINFIRLRRIERMERRRQK